MERAWSDAARHTQRANRRKIQQTLVSSKFYYISKKKRTRSEAARHTQRANRFNSSSKGDTAKLDKLGK